MESGCGLQQGKSMGHMESGCGYALARVWAGKKWMYMTYTCTCTYMSCTYMYMYIQCTKMPCSDTLVDHFQFLTVWNKNFTCGKIDTNVIVHVQPWALTSPPVQPNCQVIVADYWLFCKVILVNLVGNWPMAGCYFVHCTCTHMYNTFR